MTKVICIPTDINVKKLAKKILKNEPRIIKKYPAKSIDLKYDFDGDTGLGLNSLTSRSCHYNLLNWWGTGLLRKWIRQGYEEYNNIRGRPLYVQCWANVMRKGEKIGAHIHASHPTLAEHAHLSGHLSVQVDGTTSTYYDGNPILNKSGLMSFFPGRSLHWTDRYEGNSERITVAFDIHSKEFYEYDIFDYAKHHWIRI